MKSGGKELLQIAENCRRVPAYRPETYWQAIQMYWFVHLAVTTELNPWDAYSPGRLDQHLIGFYRKDLEAGILDRQGAKELLECLWVKFNKSAGASQGGDHTEGEQHVHRLCQYQYRRHYPGGKRRCQ